MWSSSFFVTEASMFYKKTVLKNFAIFTRKQLCSSLFLTKLQAQKPATLLKRDFNASAFSGI